MPTLTEECRLIQEAARQFTFTRILPIANKLDPERGKIPRELIDEVAELGYFGILIPEEYGGLGLGAYEYFLVAEQLSRGWMNAGSLIARGNLLIGALNALSPQKKAEYLPRMARGHFLCRSQMQDPTSLIFPAGPYASVTNGKSLAGRASCAVSAPVSLDERIVSSIVIRPRAQCTSICLRR
jgi:butyryl-CoA dehydrogenase/acyl-CoA dehydrogenase